MHQSLTCGAMWTALLMLLLYPLADELVTAMGLTGKAADAATEYLRIELCVLPFIMVERVAIACLRAAGDTVSGLVVMTIVNVVNMALSYALCVGWGPFPELGWRGIAIGTALGHCCGGLLLLALLATGRAGYRLRLSHLWPDFAMIRRILRIGIPAGLDSMLLVACQFLYVRIVNSLGDVASAAHGVALQVEAIAYMPGGAFQIAASTVVGQYLGAGEPRCAAHSVLWACGAASVIMGSAGLVFYFAGEWLIGLFFADGNRAVIPLAAEALRIITLVLVPLAITMVTSGALRGAGDTFWPLIYTLIGLAVVRVPLASYLAPRSLPRAAHWSRNRRPRLGPRRRVDRRFMRCFSALRADRRPISARRLGESEGVTLLYDGLPARRAAPNDSPSLDGLEAHRTKHNPYSRPVLHPSVT